MPLDITYLGHAGLLLDDGQSKVVIDPFLSGNGKAKHKPEDIQCDYVALTHGHADHFGDTLPIAKANNATVVAVHEICEYCGEQGIEQCEPGNPGGAIKTDFGSITFTQAFHSSSYEGRYMGMPTGLVLRFDKPGVTLYHAGDTGLFSDMRLIGEIYRPDVAALPCGDRFTMGPKLAQKAAELIRPKHVIPIHFATFDLLTDDISDLQPLGVEVREMKIGETWSYE